METHALVARLRGIYAIVNEGVPDPVELTRAVLEGGARIVQYRAKSGIVPEHARAIRDLTQRFDALFLLNDAWNDVERYGADGAHIGPDDADPAELARVRSALQGRIFGISCGTPEEARAAQRCGADYIGVGCIYPTASKADAGEPIGIAGLQAVARACTLPVAAIGGITQARLPELRAAGAGMAAIIGAISQSADPRAATAALVNTWNAHG